MAKQVTLHTRWMDSVPLFGIDPLMQHGRVYAFLERRERDAAVTSSNKWHILSRRQLRSAVPSALLIATKMLLSPQDPQELRPVILHKNVRVTFARDRPSRVSAF